MSESNSTPTQGKTDPVDVRAAEIAKREGRDTISDKDREVAFQEMQKTSPPAEEAPNETGD